VEDRKVIGRDVTLLIGNDEYHRPDAVLVIDGRKCNIDFETRSSAPLDTGNKQLMAYAAGLDYGHMEARTLAYMATVNGDDVVMTPVDLGTMMHKRLELEFMAMDEQINFNGRRDVMLKKAVDQLAPMCLEGTRPGKRRKPRDWDQRDRKHRGR